MTVYTYYTYVQIDPRQKIQPEFGLGIEISDPRFLSGQPNIHHHGVGTTVDTLSAAEQALYWPLPPKGTVIAFQRADADAFTAAAVLESRAQGREYSSEIVQAIGELDRLGPEAKPMVSREITIPIMRVAVDYNRSIEDRIDYIHKILDGTADPEEMAKMVEQRDREFAAAKADSTVTLVADGRIAVVVSTHRFATNLGYELAKVVVATNPKMAVMEKNAEGKLVPTGVTYLKHTLAIYDSHVPFDGVGAFNELRSLEPGWGGHPASIHGSTQNEDSVLTTEQVVEIASKYLL